MRLLQKALISASLGDPGYMNAALLLCAAAALMAAQGPPASPVVTTGTRSGLRFRLKSDPAGNVLSPKGSRYSLSQDQQCEVPCVNPDCWLCLRPAAPPGTGGDAAAAGPGSVPNAGRDTYLPHNPTSEAGEVSPTSAERPEGGAMHAEAGHYDRGSGSSMVPGSVADDSDVAAGLACAEGQDGLGNALANADGSMANPNSEVRLSNAASGKIEAAAAKKAHVVRHNQGFAAEPKNFQGGPRTLAILHNLNSESDIFSTGMFFDTRNNAEIAMAEYCEVQEKNYKTPCN